MVQTPRAVPWADYLLGGSIEKVLSMEAKELRVGNFVYHKYNNEFYQITSATISALERGEDYPEPIPLTEEWLKRFGWVWNEECKSFEKQPNGDARMNLEYRKINGSYTMFNYVLKALIAKRIWYVHQLQNLYFALTGKELTINKNTL